MKTLGSTRPRRWLLLATVLWLYAGLVHASPERADPLLGRVLDASGSDVPFDTLIARMAEADVVYLGENHNNAHHHAGQRRILRALAGRGLQPALGFEFFDVGQTGFLQQHVSAAAAAVPMHAGPRADPEATLRRQLGWTARSDRDWDFYFTLVDIAREYGLPVFGADLPAGIILALSRGGRDSLNAVARSLLTAPPATDKAYEALMKRSFRDAHCGWGEEPMLTHLWQTWQARNARMARAIVDMAAETQGPLVIILGKGHTAHGRAVPGAVAALAPDLVQVNFAFQEIAPAPAPAAAYFEAAREGGTDFGPAHELLWFTQRHDYRDPCAGFGKTE